MVERDAVLSEILAAPGATHSVFDVLAACVVVLAPGPSSALLGFAGGGMIAPLRAMGWEGRVDGVDLDPRGERIFRDLSSSWCGEIAFAREEASRWLARRRRRFDAIVDDLSVPWRDEVTKPEASHGRLPGLIRRRLSPEGVAVVNALPVPRLDWTAQIESLVAPHGDARMILFEEFENRIVLGSTRLPRPRALGSAIRGALARIGSRIGGTISVRDLAP
jgi:hypothetical protein